MEGGLREGSWGLMVLVFLVMLGCCKNVYFGRLWVILFFGVGF